MALTKRVYVDGETIITAQNLNDIQDEIISQGNTLVPKTRTVNSKALSTNIMLSASDVGAAPTSHASSATTYGKGTSSNYGHVQLTDSLSDSTTAATGGLALSAKAGYDLKGAITNGTLLNGMPQTAMRIPANADMNSYTTAGTYYINSDADAGTITNMPRSASGTLFVINRAAGNYKLQIYIPTSSIETIFKRNYNNGSWTSWTKSEQPIIYQNTVFSYDAFGWISSDRTELFVHCPIGIFWSTTASILTSIDYVHIALRIPAGGYVISNDADVLSYLTSAEIQSFGRGLYLRFYKSDGFANTNNIPVAGTVNIRVNTDIC